MRRILKIGLALGVTLAVAAPGSAADDELAPTPEQITERTSGVVALWNSLRAAESGIRVRFEPALVSSGKYEGSRLWWVRTGASIEGAIPITEEFNLGISPSFAFERLIAKGSDAFVVAPSGRDSNVSDFFDGSLSVGGKYDFTETWGIEFVVGSSARQEAGSAFSDSLQFGGSLAGTYRRGSWLRLRLGIGLGADLDDGVPRISPVYRIVVKPYPGFTLETSGLNGSLAYDVSKRTTLTLAGGQRGTQYNLEKRSRPPLGLGRGTLQRRESGLTMSVGYRARSWLRLTAEVGLALEQELSVLNSEGIVVDKRSDRSPSPNARLRFDFRL